MYQIEHDFLGANIKILSQRGERAEIDVELRDTTKDWFYWCFRVVGAAGQTVTFHFPNDVRVGYFGAAISHDYENWHWQYEGGNHSGDTFTYTFSEDENSVYFAHDFCYRPERFFNFARSRNFEIKTLCQSEKGRDVPYLDLGRGKELILLTARHHACEATGSYVLEGVLDAIANDPFFLEHYRIVCVPMVDIDGVTDGDQGKSRAPYDHNKDYQLGTAPIYNAIREICALVDTVGIKFGCDFHSPWHLGGENDTLFFPMKDFDMATRMARFSALYEAENRADALPHYAQDDVQPNVRWNVLGTPGFAYYMGSKGAELAFTLETPYFKASEAVFSPERAYESGKNLVGALKKYIEA